MSIDTIKWVNGKVKLIDQTKLPQKLEYVYCQSDKQVWQAIKQLSVRGAPAIGVAGAFGVLLEAEKFDGTNLHNFIKRIRKVCAYLATSRPTAVNLFYALDRMQMVLDKNQRQDVNQLKGMLKREAMAMYEEDRQVCRMMGQHGSKLIKDDDTIMTVCNAGALATVDYGTALGVMYSAKQEGKNFKVYACETRPLLQGARLTAWELTKSKIDTTVICDNMAASLMKSKKINAIFTGADRIAANGDAANKIGTYSLAVLAKHHRIPFYVVAPFSTFDLSIKDGTKIPIEQRLRGEVASFQGIQTVPKKAKVYNPAFDVTEAKLITAIVTELGIIKKPSTTNIKKTLSSYDR